MKNTTFRKKALLSSVAMLLVALVALGSATFAWFTSSTQATANQLSVKTIKSSTLEVATKDTTNWGTTVSYMAEGAVKTLLPASSANATNWYTATAADGSSYATADDFQTISDLSNYVFVDQLNIRNAGDAAVENVKISFSLSEVGSTGLQYARVALVPTTVDRTAASFDFSEYVYDCDGDNVAAAAPTTDNKKGTKSVSATDATQTVYIDVTAVGEKLNGVTKDESGKIISYDTRSYDVFVWFEGQDLNCSDKNAGNELPNVTFTVAADVASQV